VILVTNFHFCGLDCFCSIGKRQSFHLRLSPILPASRLVVALSRSLSAKSFVVSIGCSLTSSNAQWIGLVMPLKVESALIAYSLAKLSFN
jgi:hypothetical protein